MTICWMAHLRPRPGADEQLREVLKSMVGPTREEAGCVAYDLHESMSEARRQFSFYEIWRSEADHAAHMKSPHVRVLLMRQSELVDGDILLDHLTLIS